MQYPMVYSRYSNLIKTIYKSVVTNLLKKRVRVDSLKNQSSKAEELKDPP